MKDPLFYRIVRPIITFLFKIFYRPTYIGLENIPKTGRIVLGGNHTNNLDCLLLISSTKRVVHFLAKDSLMKGLKKIIFKNMGIIPVNRSIHDKEALRSAIKYLDDEKLVCVFPEGTINRTEEIIMPFKIGCVKMAKETNSSIIPYIITGEYKLFKKSIKIEFLKPFITNSKTLTEDNEKLMSIIRNKLKEMRN